MVTKPGVTIDDGFTERVPKNVGGNSNGAAKPESGSPEPQRASQRESQPEREHPELVPGIDTISPFEFGDTGGTATETSDSDGPRKRRGRPSGSKNRTPGEEKTPSNLTLQLQPLIGSAYFAMSKFFEAPELELSEPEAQQYADALKGVLSQYETVLNPKVLAWSQFSMVMVAIHGPRFVAIAKRGSKDKPPRPQITPTPIRKAAEAQPQTQPARPQEISLVGKTPSELWAENGESLEG